MYLTGATDSHHKYKHLEQIVGERNRGKELFFSSNLLENFKNDYRLVLIDRNSCVCVCARAVQVAAMGEVGRINPRLVLQALVLALVSCIAIASAQDDMDSWLQFMADTSSDYESEITTDTVPAAVDSSPYSGSMTAGERHHHKDKTGASIGMFVKFPKPKGPAKKITVSKSGKDDFTTINAALDSIAEHNKFRTIIHIRAGVYE